MFTKVLIANRGAIATRIIRTLKTMQIQSLAVFAEADRDSLHVRQADESICLGEGAVATTYLDQDKLIAMAIAHGAQAIHPGYGFLSENPGFVEKCEAAGLIFIGPTSAQMHTFGLKHTARQVAEDSGVPLLPGSPLLQHLEEAQQEAQRIGYPVMLKSTAGGGGIGMQVCGHAGDLADSFARVKRLGANNFANDGVFVEKYIERARHIEVQIFGDGQGQAVALGERDCSVQRRHQKVIEETPAPDLPQAVREQLHAVAVQLVAAVNYRNAGTVEFIYDAATQRFYFLEVNTRLQVEHGVTEQVYGVDLVEWMLLQAAGELTDLNDRVALCRPRGHAIQARLYAENPHKNFQPAAGLLCHVNWPSHDGHSLRIDSWVESGVEVSPYYDPLLAKMISWAESREQAIAVLDQALQQTQLQGIETNLAYCRAIITADAFRAAAIHTRWLSDFPFTPNTIDVLKAGTLTTIQDYPGRVGYWSVGVPPSGPFDSYSFRLGNRLLGNPEGVAGLEVTLNGPTLQFNRPCRFLLAGATLQATLNDKPVAFWQMVVAQAGDCLSLGKTTGAGARAYVLFAGGIDGHYYLGSRATFTLGQFGGFSGRALRTGDSLHLLQPETAAAGPSQWDRQLIPELTATPWQLRVTYGPHGAPDFFTEAAIAQFFATEWEIHFNSSRTGIRLIGPKPQWARESGGEAGMHPSNIHDNAYALGTVDFTGDMPVILGPDGPSLGGFVCPATVITADLWKLGQLKAGDRVSFVPVDPGQALALEQRQREQLATLRYQPAPVLPPLAVDQLSAIVKTVKDPTGTDIVYRLAGDKYLLVEYGPLILDIRLRFRAHALMLWLEQQQLPGIFELTPGIRSLQIHYDNFTWSLERLLALLEKAEQQLTAMDDLQVPSRIVHLPLSWDDAACQQAIDKYMQSVRQDAPWCPSNIEFIRRINGLDSVAEVKQTVFSASYVVMGLGDVYLGAPVATPLDPRHRLVTTKYNPARTWTAENSVGIGGAYLCVYGMEGPGGYQFVGRTLQMWNRYRQTCEFTQPWLLRFFDQIRFYEVSAEELHNIRQQFPRGQYPLQIEETQFSLADYAQFLEANRPGIEAFVDQRNRAFQQELARWQASGQLHFESQPAAVDSQPPLVLAEGQESLDSPVAGNLWQWLVEAGDSVTAGQTLAILESMKMEVPVHAPCDGSVQAIHCVQGQQVNAGQCLAVVAATGF